MQILRDMCKFCESNDSNCLFNIGNMLIYSRTKILQKYCLVVFYTLESL